MAGTPSGNRKGVQTKYLKYGKGHFAEVGAEGGKRGNTGGFHTHKSLARTAGRLGGILSKRGQKTEVCKRTAAKRRYWQEMKAASDSQTMKLTAKFGSQRPW